MNAERVEREVDDNEYLDYLHDIYGYVKICGIEYDAGNALRNIDPIAFNCGRGDYESMLNDENDEDVQWECGECGEVYDDEGEAENCCMVACEKCGKLYDDPELAEECCEGTDEEIVDEGNTKKVMDSNIPVTTHKTDKNGNVVETVLNHAEELRRDEVDAKLRARIEDETEYNG